jgi:ADP-heptose:LPS heptosyltransferase
MAHSPRILISRTDAIGDVMLTLPLASILRQHLPEAKIGFLGRSYTRAVVDCCSAVDEFVELHDFLRADTKKIRKDWDSIIHVFPRKDIAQKAWRAGIAQRIGTSSRPYHWLTCNRRVKLSRRQSELHEAQLNTKLLAPLGITKSYSKEELGRLYSFDKIPPMPAELAELFEPGKRYIILHPKSQGSAREWGLEHFISLIRLLPKDRYQIFISGTAKEAELLTPLFDAVGGSVTDITGRMDLSGFIAFIDRCDALVAASTGPLHIAAALGKQAIGIYPAIRPMHPGRWAPLGEKALALSLEKDCRACLINPQDCACIKSIRPLEVAQKITEAPREQF